MGRRHVSVSTFNAHDSNTICDITGFKVKKSEVVKRWEGFFVVPDAWHPRHEQDKPVIPKPQKTYRDIRTQAEDEITPETFDTI